MNTSEKIKKLWRGFKEAVKQNKPDGGIAFRGGTYSLALTGLVLAVIIAVNVFVSVLPKSWTTYDMSATKLYSITSNTKVVVNALTDDVTIYWICQSGEEDEVIENLLSKYKSLSDHIDVVKKNPDVYPTFAEKYTGGSVTNNSLVVECGEKYRYIDYSEIYVSSTDMYSYSYTTSFDGEGAVTSAIDYVTNEEFPHVYVLEGHGEADLPSTFSDYLEKDNIEIETVSLLNGTVAPEDESVLLIYAPTSDISEREKELLTSYVAEGGKLMVAAGPTEDGSLENLEAFLEQYGVSAEEGIVIEEDSQYMAYGYPYVLLPELQSSDITDSLIESSYYALFPLSQGLKISDAESSDYTVTELLTTSESSFSKLDGYELSTYEKESKDIDGPFSLGVDISNTEGGEIVWFSSSAFLDDSYNSYSSGANVDLAMNALSNLIGDREALAIRSKSLNYNYLTISDSTSALIKLLMIGIFPLAYLGIGIVVIMKRRGLQNETL